MCFTHHCLQTLYRSFYSKNKEEPKSGYFYASPEISPKVSKYFFTAFISCVYLPEYEQVLMSK